MCLGALVDAGVSLKEIEKTLKGIPVKGYVLSAKKVSRSGLAATKVDVIIKGSGAGKSGKWNDISRIIRASKLPEVIRHKGHEIYRRIQDSYRQLFLCPGFRKRRQALFEHQVERAKASDENSIF